MKTVFHEDLIDLCVGKTVLNSSIWLQLNYVWVSQIDGEDEANEVNAKSEKENLITWRLR